MSLTAWHTCIHCFNNISSPSPSFAASVTELGGHPFPAVCPFLWWSLWHKLRLCAKVTAIQTPRIGLSPHNDKDQREHRQNGSRPNRHSRKYLENMRLASCWISSSHTMWMLSISLVNSCSFPLNTCTRDCVASGRELMAVSLKNIYIKNKPFNETTTISSSYKGRKSTMDIMYAFWSAEELHISIVKGRVEQEYVVKIKVIQQDQSEVCKVNTDWQDIHFTEIQLSLCSLRYKKKHNTTILHSLG